MVTVAVQRRPVGDGGEFLVRQRHRSGEAHLNAPVGGQAQFGDRRPDGLGRLASGLEIAVVENGLDIDEPPQIRRLGRAPREQPAPREEGMLAVLDPLQGVGNRGERGFQIFKRRFFVTHALERLRHGAEDPAQRRIGGERAQERLRLDQFIHVALKVGDAEEEDAVAGEEFAAVRPGDGADHILAGGERLDQRVRRFVRRFRRLRVDDRDDQVGALREQPVELDLLLAPGKRTRQELARVGVDGDVARDIDAGERRRDEEGGNDDPRMTGRQAHGPRDRGDDKGAVTFDHGSGVEAMVCAGCQSGRCDRASAIASG